MFVPNAPHRFPKLLTAKQVADLLGVSAAAIRLGRLGAMRDHGEDVGPQRYALSDRTSGV